MPDLTHHRPLSPVEVLDLRVGAKAIPANLSGFSHAVVYNPSADTYELRHGPAGPVVTHHRDISVLCALLRGEAFEPGFIRRVLDPSYMPDEIALDADAREQARRERAAIDARTRAQRAEAEEQRRARLRASGGSRDAPDDLSVDDLFNTL